MKAIIFARVSTANQDLEQQEQVLLQTAKSDGYSDKNIIIISEHESGVKNDISERLGITKAKEAIEQGDVEVIYAFELSRIARRLDVFYDFRKYLIEHKIQLKIINPKVSLLDDKGEIDENFSLVFSIFASLAEQEARLLQARMKRGKDKAKKENRYTGGQIPFGYYVNKEHKFVIKEDERDIVRRIFNDYQTKTVVDIAKDLVFEGLVKTNVNSTASLVRNILHRKEYIGTDKFPGIITKEEYDEVSKKIVERRKYCKTKSKHVYLCRGIVYNINHQQLRPFYSHKCYAYANAGKYNWETLSINMPFLDEIAFHYAIENKKRKPGKDLMRYKVDLQNELKVLSKKASTISKKIEEYNEQLIRIETRYISGKISEEVADLLSEKVQKEINLLNKENQSLEDDREDLKKRLNNLLKSPKESFLGNLRDLTEEDKEKIVHEEIERIVVIKGKKRYDYVLGIQYFSGDYVMVDANARYKRVFENGEEKTSLLHSKEEK